MESQYEDGISIIMPVHNNEKTLEKCIKSIKNQTYKKFELIIIDDGSSDFSSLICRKFVEQDKRISYFYKKNEGVCSARNLGLMKINFPYVTFIDADDYIEKEHLENFTKYINNYDIVMQGMRYVNAKGKEINSKLNEKIYTEVTKIAKSIKEINREVTNLPAFGWVTNKLYRAEIIKEKNIFFSTTPIINGDRAFNLNYFLFINSFIMLHTVTYNYTENYNSISHKFIDPILFVLAANEYSYYLKQNHSKINLSDIIINYSIKFYIRAIGECFLLSNNIKIYRRIYIIYYSLKSFIKSKIWRKNLFKLIKYMIISLNYYLNKYKTRNFFKYNI